MKVKDVPARGRDHGVIVEQLPRVAGRYDDLDPRQVSDDAAAETVPDY